VSLQDPDRLEDKECKGLPYSFYKGDKYKIKRDFGSFER
jgi:hypothetical protein